MPTLLLLPTQTAPAGKIFKRRHIQQPAKDYTAFRDCLRWEFGFTCAICLLHERDIISSGIEGWGVTQIEHLVPRSQDKTLIGEYTNLIYICRLCNLARSDNDLVDKKGHRLLDPTKDVWSQHFQISGDRLVPFAGNVHAIRTEDVYDINAARKVELRRVRRECVSEMMADIRESRRKMAALNRKARGRHAKHVVDAIAAVRGLLERSYRDARKKAWLPDDVPISCRCGRARARTLPPSYIRQGIRLKVP